MQECISSNNKQQNTTNNKNNKQQKKQTNKHSLSLIAYQFIPGVDKTCSLALCSRVSSSLINQP